YNALVEGRESPLDELPIQYADYAQWQREWLQGEELERQLSYWKKHLGGNLPLLQLPTDHPRPALKSFLGAEKYLLLDRSLTESLKELSRKEGVTLFMTLMAAFQVLLH